MDTDLAGLSLFESDDIHNFSPSLGVYKSTARGYIGVYKSTARGYIGVYKSTARSYTGFP
jgi:hypothetical protein